MPAIKAISYYLPSSTLTNEAIHGMFPEWSVDKISDKTGIRNRHIAGEEEFASDLAVTAAQRLFEQHHIDPAQVDFILLCTQSPDYWLPTTACLVQDRLGIPTTSGALDYNLGCSGYIYGLNLAKGILLTGDVKNVLLITTETYSKFLEPSDKGVRTIFGDAASATWLAQNGHDQGGEVGRFAFGTDGSGAQNLIVHNGGARRPGEHPRLFMNGPDIFTFTLKRVPDVVDRVLKANNLTIESVGLFIFHQANRYMLEHLQKKMNIPDEKNFLFLENCGNTVSATIPIALSEAMRQGRIQKGMKVLLCGFGVGYSWGATVIQF